MISDLAELLVAYSIDHQQVFGLSKRPIALSVVDDLRGK